MKKINIILFFMCLCSFSAMSQEKIKTDMAEITMPKIAHKLTKEQRMATLDKKFTEEEILRGRPAHNDYEIGGLLLTLNYRVIDGSKDYLIKTKTDKANRRRRLELVDDYYEAVLSEVNGKKTLVTRQKSGHNYNYYLFFMVNANFTYQVSGTLKYLPEEEPEAKKYLTEILNKIVIKN